MAIAGWIAVADMESMQYFQHKIRAIDAIICDQMHLRAKPLADLLQIGKYIYFDRSNEPKLKCKPYYLNALMKLIL